MKTVTIEYDAWYLFCAGKVQELKAIIKLIEEHEEKTRQIHSKTQGRGVQAEEEQGTSYLKNQKLHTQPKFWAELAEKRENRLRKQYLDIYTQRLTFATAFMVYGLPATFFLSPALCI